MKDYELIDAVGGIDRQLIENAAKEGKKPSGPKTVLLSIACIMLTAVLIFAVTGLTGAIGQTAETVASPDISSVSPVNRSSVPETSAALNEWPAVSEIGEPTGSEGETPAAFYPDGGPYHSGTDISDIHITPMISGYGEMTYTDISGVENGDVLLSEPLRSAMDHFGEDALYRVLVEFFREGVRIPSDSDVAEEEARRLFASGYTPSVETVLSQGETVFCVFTIHATYQQLLTFQKNDSLGFYLLLYDEYFGKPKSTEISF